MNAYYDPFWNLNDGELEHHGVLGMKWGIRRYQNKDGTLTNLGKKRHNLGIKIPKTTRAAVSKQVKDDYNNLSNSEFRKKYKASKATYRIRNLAAYYALLGSGLYAKDVFRKGETAIRSINTSTSYDKAMENLEDYIKNHII